MKRVSILSAAAMSLASSAQSVADMGAAAEACADSLRDWAPKTKCDR